MNDVTMIVGEVKTITVASLPTDTVTVAGTGACGNK